MHDELERERTPVDVASHERSFQDESHSGSLGTAYGSRLTLKQGRERSFPKRRSIPSGLCVFIPLLVFRFREMKLLRNDFRNLPSGDFPVFLFESTSLRTISSQKSGNLGQGYEEEISKFHARETVVSSA